MLLLLLLLLFLLFLNKFFAMNNLHFSLFNETPFSSMSEMKFNVGIHGLYTCSPEYVKKSTDLSTAIRFRHKKLFYL